MECRICDICKTNVHRAFYAKLLRSKKHLENGRENEMFIPEWFFKEPNENEIKEINNPKTLKQIARKNIRLDVKQLITELAKKINIRCYFTDRALQVRFNITLEIHHINHASFKSSIKPDSPEIGIEVR